jgi:hypothetical protein
VRLFFSPLLIVVLGACSSHSPSSAPVSSYDEGGGEDGSTFGCTSLGGTCEPIASSGCPLLQQNDELCDNVILVCCLPAGSQTVSGEEGGEEAGEAAEGGGGGPLYDAAAPTDGPLE